MDLFEPDPRDGGSRGTGGTVSALSRLLHRARTHVARPDGVEPYPDLVPLELDLPPKAAYVAALAAARAMPLWRIAVEDPAARRIAA